MKSPFGKERRITLSIWISYLFIVLLFANVAGIWAGHPPSRWVLTSFLFLLAVFVGDRVDRLRAQRRMLRITRPLRKVKEKGRNRG